MKFYLEAMKNDIDIQSLDCDIELDRAQLNIDYYSAQKNFYNESSNDDYYTEGTIGRYIIEGVSNAIIKVIDFISTCIEKLNELFAKSKLEKLKKEYEKAAKEDPSIKDRMVTFVDRRAIIDERNKLIKEIKKSEKTRKERKEDVEAMTTRSGQYKTKTTLKLAAAFTLLTTVGGLFLGELAAKKADLRIDKRNLELKIVKRAELLAKKRAGATSEDMAKLYEDEECEQMMLLMTLEKANSKDKLQMVMDLYDEIVDIYSHKTPGT